MNIGIDIDGTVANLYESLIPYVRERKKNPKLKDITTYNMKGWNLEGNKLTEILKGFEHTGEYLTLKPYKNSIKVVNELYENNKIYFLTARDQYQGVSWDTLYWLFSNGFKLDGMFTKLRTKHNKIKELEIDLLIEDNPNEIDFEANYCGLNCIIYDQPWNQEIKENDLIKRCKSWKEIRKYLGKKNEKEISRTS